MKYKLGLHVGESLDKIKLNVVLSLLEYMILISLEKTAGLTTAEITKKISKEYDDCVPNGVILLALFSMETAGFVCRTNARFKDTYQLTDKGKTKIELFKMRRTEVLGFTQNLLKEG